jgi:hypothetical protein
MGPDPGTIGAAPRDRRTDPPAGRQLGPEAGRSGWSRNTAPASGAPGASCTYGASKRRSWRKLHIGFDAVTGRIVAAILTDRDVDEASQVEPLLDQIADPVVLFLGDGGYDRTNVYTTLDQRHPP